MTDFELQIDDAELQRRIASASRRLPAEAQRAEQEGAEVQRRMLADEVPRRSGAMASSFHVEAVDGGTGAVSRHPGASMIDRGGVVRPKEGSALAIPFSSSGVARTAAARSLGLVVVRPEARRPLLAEVSAGGFEPHFTLVDQVRIRGTRYVSRAQARARKPIEQAAVEAAERAVG